MGSGGFALSARSTVRASIAQAARLPANSNVDDMWTWEAGRIGNPLQTDAFSLWRTYIFFIQHHGPPVPV